jgi:hypothetical protein
MGFVPSFRPPHNSNKCRLFILLYQERGTSRYFTAEEIHEYLGIEERSLFTELPRWVRYKYILRKNYKDVYAYHIAAKGIH